MPTLPRAGGATGASTKYIHIAHDATGTGAAWVQFNTVTAEIGGVVRTVFYQ
ncbi:MAG: hypothetical protein H7844_06880 [Nitrospirae bacterium YQR-1]